MFFQHLFSLYLLKNNNNIIKNYENEELNNAWTISEAFDDDLIAI